MVTIKSTERGVFLGHPSATPGWSGDTLNYGVKNVPPGTPATEVLRLFRGTSLTVSADSDWVVDFAELGEGKIVRLGMGR